MADENTEQVENENGAAEDEAPALEAAPEAPGTVGDADYSATMGKNFLVYAVSVITERSLPSIDGLKPVQRRVLLAMRDRRAWPGAKHVKSAKVVGDTMGAYHPHGDASIYGALVNMAQDFTMRVPLVDPQGNFGSIFGDNAAAQRYTECRLQQAGFELLDDLDPMVLPDYYGRNYDESMAEPKLLPARFPNVLINGVGTGIAVGLTTTILPHNPEEMLNLCSWRLKNPDAKVEKMIERISGPDFPTGAMVVDDEGLRQSYLTGKGKVTAVAKAHIEPMSGNREKIVITEVPWNINVGAMLDKLVAKYRDGKFPELTHLANFSKGDHGIKIVAELKRDSNAKAVLQRLLNEVGLRQSYGVEMNVLVDGRPRTLNLAEIIDHFLDFRRYVVINRAKKRIYEIERRLHKLDAYMKVIDATDAVVQTIKKAKDRASAKPSLKKLLKIDDEQAQWIVEMPLGQLTALDRFQLKEEVKELTAELKQLQKFIKTESLVTEAMIGEFTELKGEWKKAGLLERKTNLIEANGDSAEDFAAISGPAEDCLLLISRSGRAICGQGTLRRGASLNLDASDELVVVEDACTDQEWMIFTASGKAFRLRLAELPLEQKRSRGLELNQVIGIESGDAIVGAERIDKEAKGEGALLFVSAAGMIKRTARSEFGNVTVSGVAAAKPGDGDQIISVQDCPDDADVLLLGSHGKAIRFAAADCRLMGRVAGGVRGIKLPDGERVAGVLVIGPEDAKKGQLLMASSGGFAKRVPLEEIPSQGRGGGGVVVMKPGGKYGAPILGVLADDGQEMWLDAGGGKLKPYPVAKAPKAKRAIVPKRWPGEKARFLFLREDGK
jgi:DNA gyrase subunit A